MDIGVFVSNIIFVIIGFVFGFLSTLLTESWRLRRKRKRFLSVACGDLEQALATLVCYALHPDAEIDGVKAKLCCEYMNEFNLIKKTCPLVDKLSQLNKFSPKDYDQTAFESFAVLHNKKRASRLNEGLMMTLNEIRCSFLFNNTETISLLDIKVQSRLLSIIHRIHNINDLTENLCFCYRSTFDGSIGNNHDIMKKNFQSTAQLTSDFCYETSKEIADFLRKYHPCQT